MSANMLLKALNQPGDAGLRCGLSAVLIAFSLSFAGCTVPQAVSNTKLIAPPRVVAESPLESAPAMKPPEAPSKPAQPVPQPTQRISEPKPAPAIVSAVSAIRETRPPPATASKGAEKLVSLNTPMVVRASESTPPPAEPAASAAPIAEVSTTATDAPVQALIIRGPPPQARSSLPGMKVMVGLGLGFAVAVLAIVGRVWMVRRAKPTEVIDIKKEELKMPSELLFKDPLNLPSAPVAADKA